MAHVQCLHNATCMASGPFTLEAGNVECWRIECEKSLVELQCPKHFLGGGLGRGVRRTRPKALSWGKGRIWAGKRPLFSPSSLPLPRATSGAPCCVHPSLAPGDQVLYAGKEHPESASTSPVPSLSMEIKERDKWGPRRMSLASRLFPSPLLWAEELERVREVPTGIPDPVTIMAV